MASDPQHRGHRWLQQGQFDLNNQNSYEAADFGGQSQQPQHQQSFSYADNNQQQQFEQVRLKEGAAGWYDEGRRNEQTEIWG